jgi:hypothetical protein
VPQSLPPALDPRLKAEGMRGVGAWDDAGHLRGTPRSRDVWCWGELPAPVTSRPGAGAPEPLSVPPALDPRLKAEGMMGVSGGAGLCLHRRADLVAPGVFVGTELRAFGGKFQPGHDFLDIEIAVRR